MESQRALLDELMGRNRDGDRPEEDIDDFRHTSVCKRFLCGLCPHDLFSNTKMDLGECPRLHVPKLREQYERARLAQPDRDVFGYEAELERYLVQLVTDVEKRIQRAQRRLEEQNGAQAPVLKDFGTSDEVLKVTNEIRETLRQAEEAGMDGQVSRALDLMRRVDDLKHKHSMAQANAMLSSFRAETSAATAAMPPHSNSNIHRDTTDAMNDNTNDATTNAALPTALSIAMHAPTVNSSNVSSMDEPQKLRVCDVCGAFLSIFDSDRRLAEHFGGKLHLGYLQIRRKIQALGGSWATDNRDTERRDPTDNSSSNSKYGPGATGSASVNGAGAAVHHASSRDMRNAPRDTSDRRSMRSRSRSRPRGSSSRDDHRSSRRRSRSRDRDHRRRSPSAGRSRRRR